MTVREISELKANMPATTPGGVSASDLHDVADTLEERTTQRISIQSGNYTAALSDNRSKICFNTSGPVVLTLPSNAPAGWECLVSQIGPGQVTFSNSQGNLFSRGGTVLTAGLYAVAYLLCVSNTGSAPDFVLTGDTGAAASTSRIGTGVVLLRAVTATGAGSRTVPSVPSSGEFSTEFSSEFGSTPIGKALSSSFSSGFT